MENQTQNERIEGVKSPKLEIDEIRIKSPELGEIFILDEGVKRVLKEIIQNCPAGQVENVSIICVELFGPEYEEFIKNESQEKIISDGIQFSESATTMESYFEFWNELNRKLSNYMKELFPETGTFSITKLTDQIWNIKIIGQRIKSKAFWSGYWNSNWNINFLEDKENEFSISGKISLIVHYHEEGNIQLSAEKEIPSTINFKSDSLTESVQKIYWKIKDSEDSVQLALNEAYKELADDIFKKLRRQLPVTRTKMDWSKFSNYQLSNELKK